MSHILSPRRIVLLLLLAALAVGLSSCRQETEGELAPPDDLFGDGMPDASDVVCRVGDQEISRRDMDLRLEEMPTDFRKLFSGEGAERRLLEFMISEVLQADAAIEEDLLADPIVRQQIISEWRVTLRDAYANLVLFRDLEPSAQEIKEYYLEHLDSYRTQAQLKARHIQCAERAKAEAAYAAIRKGGYEGLFANVVGVYSENERSKRLNGDLGWFSRQGFIPVLDNHGQAFAEAIFDLDIGLHEPIQVGSDWHVVEILDREATRQMTVEEVRDRIVRELEPSVRDRARGEFIDARRQDVDIQYFGKFRPGEGRSAEELLRLGMLAGNIEKAMQYYELLLLDYPESEYAPMALFMQANLYLDTYADAYSARKCLRRLLRQYPDSEVRDQAEYMLENAGSTAIQKPKSIEELRQAGH